MVGEQRDVEKHQFIPEDYFCELRKEALFAGDRPMELDIGCGDGRFLLEMAKHYPQRDFLGLERLLGRVRKVCREKIRLRKRKRYIARAEKSLVDAFLAHRLPLARAETALPAFPKARYSVTVLEIESAHDGKQVSVRIRDSGVASPPRT